MVLEEFMERLRRFSQEEHVMESLEEDFALLISQYPAECLQQAVLLTDECLPATNEDHEEGATATLRLPIHLAYDNNAPVSIIRTLLDAELHNLTILKADKWGDLPIHTACSRNHLEVIQLLLEADVKKETLQVKDVHESLPLHMAARYNAPKQVIQLLLENDPEHKTLWVNCSLWGARAEKLHPHIQKGTTLAVSGEVTLRSWSKNGREGTALELQANHLTLLGRPEPAPAPKAPEGLAAVRAPAPSDPFNDDIPF
jgi:hypothetical protein